MAGDNLKSWVSDKVMKLLPDIVDHLIAMAKSSKSSSELVPQLVSYGFSSSDARSFAQDICARTVNPSPQKTSSESRIPDRATQNFRKTKDEDDKMTVRQDNMHFQESEEDISQYQREREELERWIRPGDAARTRKLSHPGISIKDRGKAATALRRSDVGPFRKASGQEYLKKRKLDELKDMDSIQKRKLSVEQEAWEDHQIGKATLRFGAKNKQQFDVFGDQIKFVKADVLAGENYEDERLPVAGPAFSRMSAFKMLQEERKALPIYSYRDQLLKAIKDHQVLVIVGDSGSGKSTQIPQYLHEAGYTKHGKVGCTQPRTIAAMSIASRVADEMGVKLGHEVGYSVRFEDCTSEKTAVKYTTDGMLLHELIAEPDLASYSVIMVDEAHERSTSTDLLFAILKDMARRGPNLKLLISSATMDVEKISKYFDDAPVFTFPGRRFPVDICSVVQPEEDYLNAAAVAVLQIHVTEPLGDILVFLPGQEAIEKVEETLKNRIRGFGTKIRELIICPIYANLPSEVFKPTPKAARKVVLATNIAETSLTSDGITYVVDSGFCEIKTYNPISGMESLVVSPISKALAAQRSGRAGRTGPGKCFRLYSAYQYQTDMEDEQVPEIKRTNLASVLLTLKVLGINDIVSFDFMDEPPAEAVIKGFDLLFALGALNLTAELSKDGGKMAEFPLDPMWAKMIVASERFGCSSEIISIAAMLVVGSHVFFRPKDKMKIHADNARLNFHNGNVGDHIALLQVYNAWKETNYSTQWCYENYIQVRSMKRARNIRDQLERILERVEIKVSTNLRNLDLVRIRKSILAGFFPHIAKLQKDGSYKTLKHALTVRIHPSSGLSKVLPTWVLYHELVITSTEYMRQVTAINPSWLLEVAPHYYPGSSS